MSNAKLQSFFGKMLLLSVAFVVVGGVLRLLVPYTTQIVASFLPRSPAGTQSTAIRLGSETGEVMVIFGIVTGIIWLVLLGAMHFAPEQLGENA
jgi:type II secretory pathway component PulF